MIALAQNMPAIEQAVQLYHEHGLVLASDLQNYLRHPTACVVKRTELLLLFRPIDRADPGRWLDCSTEGDAWYVRLLVGRVRDALREMPHILPFVCWHRNFRAGPDGPMHTVRTETLIKKARSYHGR